MFSYINRNYAQKTQHAAASVRIIGTKRKTRQNAEMLSFKIIYMFKNVHPTSDESLQNSPIRNLRGAQRFRFSWCSRIVDGVVISHFRLQSASHIQRSSSTIAEKSVVANEFHSMIAVTRLDTIDANGIAIRSMARDASVEIVHGKTGAAADLE